ncbi:hypothetical protein BV898_07024 [Hypsibius exemplaris]|uniref:Uncharacterized protein n=1 Tax=Hypsibius exemplaris TaxID=2072580 RepID=A0A1W0WUS8_HYPEX|nr:hypothetical protein BV898_07024 [Hypsibius exemplaris]
MNSALLLFWEKATGCADYESLVKVSPGVSVRGLIPWYRTACDGDLDYVNLSSGPCCHVPPRTKTQLLFFLFSGESAVGVDARLWYTVNDKYAFNLPLERSACSFPHFPLQENMAVKPASSTTVGASPRNAARPAGAKAGASGDAARGARKTGASSAGSRTTRSAVGAGGGSGGMWRFYSEDSPGIRVGPVPVLVMSLGFIALVFLLHIWGNWFLLLGLLNLVEIHRSYLLGVEKVVVNLK